MFPLLDFCDRRILILSFAQKNNYSFFSSFFGQCDISVQRLHHVHSNCEIDNYKLSGKDCSRPYFLTHDSLLCLRGTGVL